MSCSNVPGYASITTGNYTAALVAAEDGEFVSEGLVFKRTNELYVLMRISNSSSSNLRPRPTFLSRSLKAVPTTNFPTLTADLSLRSHPMASTTAWSSNPQSVPLEATSSPPTPLLREATQSNLVHPWQLLSLPALPLSSYKLVASHLSRVSAICSSLLLVRSDLVPRRLICCRLSL